MKREIRLADPARGIIQVTTVDERWYARPLADPVTGLPARYEYVPSVTYISRYYPKGVGYMKWLAGLGWNEAEAVRQAGADKGSRVHQACAALLDGRALELETPFAAPDAPEAAPLTTEEYGAVLTFADWWWSFPVPPVVLAKDLVVWGEGYAGTLDVLLRTTEAVWLIDFKTSQDVWPEHEIQVTAYGQALPEALIAPTPRAEVRLAILQLGYRRNQRGWKLMEVTPQPELFAATRAIWARETAGEAPRQVEYPMRVMLAEKPEPVERPTRNGRRKAVAV